MRKITKISSLFIVLFFALNVFSLSGFFDCKKVAIGETAIEQIFADIAMPANIVANMMSQKAQNKTPVNSTKTKDKKESFKILDYAVTAAIVFTMILASFVLCRGRGLEEYFTRMTKYPLKIPWRTCIYLLLLMKILFNIRPRAGDVYIYKYAIKKGLC